MKLLIGIVVLILGFIFGVAYDQAIFDKTLRRDLAECRVRSAVLDDALETMTQNTGRTKFKKADYIYDAVQRVNEAR